MEHSNEIKHKCNIWNPIKISETQTIYLCAICKQKVAISDTELYGVDIIVTVINLSDNKIYPDSKEISEENKKEWA